MQQQSLRFNPEHYYPCKNKNQKLVLLIADALPKQDLELFFRVAARCDKYAFVLALVQYDHDKHSCITDLLINYNKLCRNAVDVQMNVKAADLLTLIQETGIYFHTHSSSAEQICTAYEMKMKRRS